MITSNYNHSQGVIRDPKLKTIQIFGICGVFAIFSSGFINFRVMIFRIF